MPDPPRAAAENLCAYCGVNRAIHSDHVVPKSLLKKHLELRAFTWLAAKVPSCGECNWRKGTRRLVPPSWASKVAALNELLPGTEWRVWDGNPASKAFARVHGI